VSRNGSIEPAPEIGVVVAVVWQAARAGVRRAARFVCDNELVAKGFQSMEQTALSAFRARLDTTCAFAATAHDSVAGPGGGKACTAVRLAAGLPVGKHE
jgi:hypothetical protein